MGRKPASLPEERTEQSELDFGAEADELHIKEARTPVTDGLLLTASKMVDIDALHPSPHNSIFDAAKTDEYWRHLREDIKETGVITDPLIAKRDGTLISGHSRLTIAQELFQSGHDQFAKVPVRYVRTNITQEEETRRVYLSNLLRFDVPPDVRLVLEATVYPDYFTSPKTGRPRLDEPKRNTSASIGAETNQSAESIRQKRRIYAEAREIAQKRGAETPELQDIAAARDLHNQKRKRKESKNRAAGTKKQPRRITVTLLRTLAPKFRDRREDEKDSDYLEQFIRFVESKTS